MVQNSRDTRKVASRLNREGWISRKGKGDHVNFYQPNCQKLITLDMGKKEVDKNIYRSIAKTAGWIRPFQENALHDAEGTGDGQ